jgi:hypothetical protein
LLLEKRRQAADARESTIEGILDVLAETNADILEAEDKVTKDLQDKLNKRDINNREFQIRKLALTVDTTQKEIAAEEAALLKVVAKNGELSDQARAIRQKLADDRVKLAEQERDLEIEAAQAGFDKRKALADADQADRERKLTLLIRDLQAAGASELDIAEEVDRVKRQQLNDAIELKRQEIALKRQEGAEDSEIIRLNTELKKLENERQDLIRDITSAVGELARKEAESLRQLGDVAAEAFKKFQEGKIAAGEAFEIDTSSAEGIAEIEARIVSLQERIDQFRSSPFAQSFAASISAAEQEILLLQQKLLQARTEQAAKAQQEQNANTEKIAREGVRKNCWNARPKHSANLIAVRKI